MRNYRLCPVTLAALACLGIATGCTGAPLSVQGGGVPADPYPIKPGDSEWMQLESHEAMVEALTIPDCEGMSTEDLATAALNYPLWGDLFAFNDLQTGFQHVVDDSNAVASLLRRGDAGAMLLDRYRKVDPAAVATMSALEEQGEHDFLLTKFELLLAQEQVLATMSSELQRALIAEGVRKAEFKQMQRDIYGVRGQITSGLVVGRALEHLGALQMSHDQSLERFLASAEAADDALPVEIFDAARKVVEIAR